MRDDHRTLLALMVARLEPVASDFYPGRIARIVNIRDEMTSCRACPMSFLLHLTAGTECRKI